MRPDMAQWCHHPLPRQSNMSAHTSARWWYGIARLQSNPLPRDRTHMRCWTRGAQLVERGPDNLHWLARMKTGMSQQFRATWRRRLKIALATIAGVLLTGQISSEVSIPRCLALTRDSTSNSAQDLLRRFSSRHGGDAWPPGQQIAWLSRRDLRDGALNLVGQRAWWHPPYLMPDFESDVYYPWAYAVPLRWPAPFIVRVAYGVAVDGQSGGIGIDYYVTFFGYSARVHRRILGMF
jgi:hypothetical protein